MPSNDPIVSALKSKNLKARPHENPLLSKYKYNVYLDTKLTVTEAHVLSVLTDLPSGKYIAMNKHRFFTGNNISVWEEYRESMKQERYAKGKNKMKNYIEKKLEQGYPESKETYLRSGFIVRDMTQSIVKEVGEVWYRNILECGILCQISLHFTHYLYDDYVFPLSMHWFPFEILKDYNGREIF